MSVSFTLPHRMAPAAPSSRLSFAVAALCLATAAAALSGWAPIRFSIVTVFLFAGPHNWLEFRYFLTRLPARWGRLRGFFLTAFAGMIGLTVAFIILFYLGYQGTLAAANWDLALALWDTVFLLWVGLLAELRSRQNPRREWGWIWPVCFVLIALAWAWPLYWSLTLVYLHPLMAFWLLDRELKRSRPAWRPAFHACLACLPLFLAVLWWRLASAPPLVGDDALTRDNAPAIVNHAGGHILQAVSSHLLVATHTFLEMLHYGVWVVAIPLIGLGSAPWRLGRVPLARRGDTWRTGVSVFLVAGLVIVVVLWGCFLADYKTTRVVYFTVAIFHILAEVPFLLRSL